jgi:hypothetical protein
MSCEMDFIPNNSIGTICPLKSEKVKAMRSDCPLPNTKRQMNKIHILANDVC